MDLDCEAYLRVVAQKPARGRGPSIGGRSQSAQLGPCARLVLAIGARHSQRAAGWTSRGGGGMNPPPISVLGHAPMKTFFLRFFTWWNGATFGTLVWTSLYGEFVGEDEFGNRYYRTRGGKIDPTLGYERRWVIYNGTAEASIVPPSWHGWLDHTVDTPPTQEQVTPRPWWKPHRPNLTGTPGR